MLFHKALLVLALTGAVSGVLAQTAPAPSSAPNHFVFEEVVTLTPTEAIGTTPYGVRTRIPITGGTFSGPRLSGRVVPGGADWQLHRPDGSTVIDAEYMIETDDHVMIHVRNVGVTHPAGPDGPRYAWTVPTFEAPMGPYGWLNDAVFVSTLGPAGDKDHPAVRVTIYQIGG